MHGRHTRSDAVDLFVDALVTFAQADEEPALSEEDRLDLVGASDHLRPEASIRLAQLPSTPIWRLCLPLICLTISKWLEFGGRVMGTQLPAMPTDQNRIYNLTVRLERAEERLAVLEGSTTNSPSFWSRAWAIFGHQMAIAGVFYAALILIGFILKVT